MPAISTIEAELIADFEYFEDQLDRYDFLIEFGRKLPDLSPQFKTDDFLVKGCQSSVWLHASLAGENVVFEADSNTIITKGIVALLLHVYSNQTAETILNSDFSFIEKVKLRSFITSQRSNGLNAMIAKMKWYATILKK